MQLLTVLQHTHFLELGVIRMFEFVSSLRRMSVIVKKLKSTSMEVYVKGAPEVMAEICDRDSCKCFSSLTPISFLTSVKSRTTMTICFHTILNEAIASSLWQARVSKG